MTPSRFHQQQAQPLLLSLRPLVAVTAANYLWQIPYGIHEYGSRWDSLTGLAVPLILTGVWFAVAVEAAVRDWRGGRAALTAYLVTEVAFYAVHNASGAFGSDLPLSNPILLIASVLGYASTAIAVVYLVVLARARRTARRVGGSPAERPIAR